MRTFKQTAYIRHGKGSKPGKCDVTNVALTRVGGGPVVAYLGCAWGWHDAVDTLDKKQFDGGDITAWLASLNYEVQQEEVG